MAIILWMLTLLACAAVVVLLVTGFRIRYYDALPMTAAGLILLLYVLGYLRAMEYIWVIALGITGIVTVYLIRYAGSITKGQRSDICGLAAFMIMAVTVTLLTGNHVVKWWDDVNYWATDAKALYYLNGFTGKYGNVAPEFGDYPPAIQIAKWCMLKLSPYEYREGLAFAGYTLMNMIFLLPLMRMVRSADKKGHLIAEIIWMCCIMLIPGIVNDVWSYGACADVTMGIAYGAMLIAIYEIYGQNSGHYITSYIKIALYGAITALCKNTGFIWVTFAVILLIILTVMDNKHSDRHRTLLTVCIVYFIQGTWWVNCLVNRRIAKLTGALARTAAAGRVSVPEDAADKLRYYALGFLKEPMHTTRTPVLDISAFMMFVILTAAGVIIWRLRQDNGSIYRILPLYTILTGLAIYVIVLLSHMSIFASETQYGSSEVMAISISRYGAPFTIGTFMLILSILADIAAVTPVMTQGKCLSHSADVSVIMVMLLSALFILLTTDYPAYGYLLFGYREDRESDIQARTDMIDPEGQEYVDFLSSLQKTDYDALKGHRILFLRDGSRIHWVNDTYISYEVAPIATVYASYGPDMPDEELKDIVTASHAEYIYRDGELIGVKE